MSRLSIEIDPEQHRQIKTLATYEGLTMKEFILKRTLQSRSKAKVEQDTTEKLLSHPKNRERLLEAIQTPTEDYLVFESMEELEDALKI
jgi:uncharacterized protein (DUF1778 family)